MPSFWDMWETLRAFGCDADGGTSRLAFSDADVKSRHYILQCMEEAHLTARIDGVGNVVGLRGSPPFVLVGSHTDTVPQGGNYDGIVGALAAIDVACRWTDTARHGLIVVDWSSEESSRFGISTIGSRAALGELVDTSWETSDRDGITLKKAAHQAYGYPKTRIWQVPTRDIRAAIELHIEQGHELLDARQSVAVVSGIAAPQRWAVALSGKPDHTGSAAMNSRHDALCGAAELVLMVEATSRQLEHQGLRTTVSRMVTHPGVSNIVPYQVELLIDVRAQSEVLRSAYERALEERLDQLRHTRGLKSIRTVISLEEPSELSRDVMDMIRQAAKTLGITCDPIISWPSHDSLALARHLPAGMIFVRNVSGVSHQSDEFCDAEDINLGIQLFEAALAHYM